MNAMLFKGEKTGILVFSILNITNERIDDPGK